ncbi:PIG-L deacetylase family protein [Marinoscillum sp. MHG1-6]|uniref:PIG-L deacetylase family protein n=1 Tax=Marinoscillum sp. MHG1-6 TaxID=2959627 RepID=UPI0021585D4D|nr:PIG-L family deacetylase [Marinoscillum sp. MHG1-6]
MKKLAPFICIFLMVISCNKENTYKQASTSSSSSGKSIMAIYSHSDDESPILPILSKYSRDGVTIYLVTVTDGSKGVTPHAQIPVGDSLTKVREDEAMCITKTLGINPPILLNYADDELALRENIYSLDDKIDSLFKKYQPDVVITWGADGGYGHPDHRIVSDIVTEVFQAKDSIPNQLLYVGWPTENPLSEHQFKTDLANYFAENLHKTQMKYLTYQIPYDEKDIQVVREAISCYKSQFTTEEQEEVFSLIVQPEKTIYFRPFFGSNIVVKDIFE